MVSDHAPVPLRRAVRAQLWLSGWATMVRPEDRRAALLSFAETSPSGALLDVGRTATLLRLDLAEVVLGEGGDGLDIGLQDFMAARPDPLAALEADTLRHLDSDHPEFLSVLSSLLPDGVVGERDVIRPLGVDRCGFRLRIERPTGHLDVRVPFPRPLSCPGQLGPAVQLMTAAGRRSAELTGRQSPAVSASSRASRVRRGRTSTSRTARASADPDACTIDRCRCARVSAV